MSAFSGKRGKYPQSRTESECHQVREDCFLAEGKRYDWDKRVERRECSMYPLRPYQRESGTIQRTPSLQMGIMFDFLFFEEVRIMLQSHRFQTYMCINVMYMCIYKYIFTCTCT